MKRLLSTVVLALALSAGGAHADPYASEQRELIRSEYQKEIDDFLERSTRVYFAAACHALQNDILASNIVSGEYAALSQEWDRRIILVGLGDMKESLAAVIDRGPGRPGLAKLAGYAKAKEPRACQYWHEHPDEVMMLRQLSGAWSQK
jgi:hypothetical protein